MDSNGTTGHVHGYSPEKQALLKRLARIEGQVRGVSGMVEADRYCIDIITQISALQAALDKVAIGLVDSHVRHCVINGDEQDQDGRVAELMAAITRLVK